MFVSGGDLVGAVREMSWRSATPRTSMGARAAGGERLRLRVRLG